MTGKTLLIFNNGLTKLPILFFNTLGKFFNTFEENIFNCFVVMTQTAKLYVQSNSLFQTVISNAMLVGTDN